MLRMETSVLKMKIVFNTPYHVAKHEMPYTSFPDLCALQRKNGLEGIGETHTNDKEASTFIGYIEKIMFADLVSLNSCVHCLILLQICLVLKKKSFILDT